MDRHPWHFNPRPYPNILRTSGFQHFCRACSGIFHQSRLVVPVSHRNAQRRNAPRIFQITVDLDAVVPPGQRLSERSQRSSIHALFHTFLQRRPVPLCHEIEFRARPALVTVATQEPLFLTRRRIPESWHIDTVLASWLVPIGGDLEIWQMPRGSSAHNVVPQVTPY